MRKATNTETGRIITMIILLISTCIPASAQSPYAMFGDNSKMLEAKSEPVNSIYRIGIKSTDGTNYYADFDLRKGLATLYDAEGNVLRQDSISENAKAIFIAMDPHAENYYHISPYAYCGDNPVRLIDPDGERPKASEAALMAAYAYKDNTQKMELYAMQLAKIGWIV